VSKEDLQALRIKFLKESPSMTPQDLCQEVNSLVKTVMGTTQYRCCESSLILAWLLREKGLDACVKVCEYCTCLEEECFCASEPHFYVLVGTKAYDPTRDQFDGKPLTCSINGKNGQNYIFCPDSEQGEPPMRPTKKTAVKALGSKYSFSNSKEIKALCKIVGLAS
jgi:hypothetical protein